jgi:hypothetical protein
MFWPVYMVDDSSVYCCKMLDAYQQDPGPGLGPILYNRIRSVTCLCTECQDVSSCTIALIGHVRRLWMAIALSEQGAIRCSLRLNMH